MGKHLISGALRTHTTCIVCWLLWVWFMVPQNNYDNNQRSQITMTNVKMMKLEIL